MSLKKVVEVKAIEEFELYSYLERRKSGISDKEIENEILGIAQKFQPHYILWSHTGSLDISIEAISKLRSLDSRPSMAYRDGDIYQSFYKPFEKQLVRLASYCDVSFWPGYSKAIEKLKNRGCRDIRYVPNGADEFRFAGKRSSEIEYDVVMVGNLVKSRIPFKTFPGTIYREKLATFFYKKLGSRFAVFGNGWKADFAKGPIPFDDQTKIYQKSRLVLATNNLHAEYYFSNRMPIVLASGVLVVHNYEVGIEQVFKPLSYPYFFNSIDEAWQKTESLLKKNQETIDEEAALYQEHILSTMSTFKGLCYIIDVLKDYKKAIDGNEQPDIRENSWINIKQF